MTDATLGRRQLKKAIWPQGNRRRADTRREGQKVVCTSFCCSKHRADTKQIKEIFIKTKSPMSGAGEIQYEGSGADNNSHRQQPEEECCVFVYYFFFHYWVLSRLPLTWNALRKPILAPLFPFNQCNTASLTTPAAELITDSQRKNCRRMTPVYEEKRQ